jgi:hypothetical protein
VSEVGIRGKYSRRIKWLIVVIAVALFLIAPSVSYAHRNMEPTFDARDESPIGGSIGYMISTTPHAPQTSVVVYNGTVNDPGADWYINYGSFYQIYDESRGIELALDGISTRADGSTTNSSVGFVGRPTLPLFNYSQVSFSINIKVLQGSANASLRVNYRAWPDFDWCEAGRNSTFLEENESTELLLRPSLDGAFNLSSGWIVRTIMLVDVISSEKSVVLIGDVVISVASNENLYPVTFDIQAPDGESLFLNPYMRSLRYAYSYSDEEKASYPAVKLTRTGNSTDSSIFGPRITNETLYLAEGEYEGTTGWFYQHGYNLSVFNISFTIEPNESILVFIRIPTLRLFIDIYPSFAYSEVTTIDGVVKYMIDYPLQDIKYLYMPIRASLGISIHPFSYDYNQATAVMLIQTNGTSCVRVTVIFSQFSIFGVVLDWGQILGILGTALLLLLLIHGAAKRSFARVRKDYNLRTNLLPVLLYYITIFFPWVTYSFDTEVTPSSTIFGAIMVPLFTTLLWSPQSQVTPTPNSYLLPNIIAIAFLYWIPVFYLSYLIATRSNSISYELLSKDTDPLLSLGVIGGPFIIGCYYTWLCIIGLCYANIGLVATLLTLPSWFVASKLRERSDRALGTHVNE